jgi:hypothetical protein
MEAMGGTGGIPPNFLNFTFIIETLGGASRASHNLPTLSFYQ